MDYFFAEKIIEPVTKLENEEAFHCIKVLRHKVGDKIALTDGNGCFAEGIIQNGSTRCIEVNIIQTGHHLPERNYSLELGIAPLKNHDRIEWLVEKVVEIGIDKISFLITENSERKTIRTDRLKKIAQAAMKQSMKFFMPEFSEPVLYNDYIAGISGSVSNLFIAHCNPQFTREKINLLTIGNPNVHLLIGPEGDFSPTEIKKAYNSGFTGVSLGNSRLRTETAAIIGCYAVSLLNT